MWLLSGRGTKKKICSPLRRIDLVKAQKDHLNFNFIFHIKYWRNWYQTYWKWMFGRTPLYCRIKCSILNALTFINLEKVFYGPFIEPLWLHQLKYGWLKFLKRQRESIRLMSSTHIYCKTMKDTSSIWRKEEEWLHKKLIKLFCTSLIYTESVSNTFLPRLSHSLSNSILFFFPVLLSWSYYGDHRVGDETMKPHRDMSLSLCMNSMTSFQPIIAPH